MTGCIISINNQIFQKQDGIEVTQRLIISFCPDLYKLSVGPAKQARKNPLGTEIGADLRTILTYRHTHTHRLEKTITAHLKINSFITSLGKLSRTRRRNLIMEAGDLAREDLQEGLLGNPVKRFYIN